MIPLANLMGGSRRITTTVPQLSILEAPVIQVVSGVNIVITLATPADFKRSGKTHYIFNNGGSFITVSRPTGGSVFVNPGQTLVAVLADKCGGGRDWFWGVRATTVGAGNTFIRAGTAAWVSPCAVAAAAPCPPPPPDPVGVNNNCLVVAPNTGQVTAAGSPCNTDGAYTYVEGGTAAKVADQRPQWIDPPEGTTAAWISSVCDTFITGETNAVRTFQVTITVLDDSVLSVKGRFAADNFLSDLKLNGVVTGIRQTDADAYKQLYQFELTRGMGLVTGTNTVQFLTQQKPLGVTVQNPFGLLVIWDGTCAQSPTAGCDAGTLSACPGTKTVTIAGGSGGWSAWNGVYTVNRQDTYWRAVLDADRHIDLLCIPTSSTRWQLLLSSTARKKRFGVASTSSCPPEVAYSCMNSAAEGSVCGDGVTATVSA